MMHWLYFWHRLFFMKYIKCKADIYYEKNPLWLVYVPYPTDTMKTSVSIHETCMKCGIADSLSCQHLQQHRGCLRLWRFYQPVRGITKYPNKKSANRDKGLLRRQQKSENLVGSGMQPKFRPVNIRIINLSAGKTNLIWINRQTGIWLYTPVLKNSLEASF